MNGDLKPVAPIEPALPYLGGKRHLAERLVTLIEAIPHDLYAEPFVGMGGIFFRRRYRPALEIINDRSADVATFFRVLRRHPAAFLEELGNWRPASRDEFDRAMKTDPALLTDIERAVRFFYLQRLAFGGKASGRAFGVQGLPRYRPKAARQLLEQIHERLATVLIECLPFEELIRRYDRPGALFYLDPPYWEGEADYGPGLFQRSDFGRMAAQLRSIQGRFILSLNDVPEIRAIFADFAIETAEVTYIIGVAHGAGDRRRELIITRAEDRGAGRLL